MLLRRLRMCTDALDSSRLYALIGESARLLPGNAVASLEVMLAAHETLRRQRVPREISNACPAASNPAAGGRGDAFGCQEREALSTILEILHSSQQSDGEGFGGELNDRLIEGLLVAGRLIYSDPPCSPKQR